MNWTQTYKKSLKEEQNYAPTWTIDVFFNISFVERMFSPGSWQHMDPLITAFSKRYRMDK